MENFDLYPCTNLFVVFMFNKDRVFVPHESCQKLKAHLSSFFQNPKRNNKIIGIQVEFCPFNGRPKIYLAQALVSIKTYTLKFSFFRSGYNSTVYIHFHFFRLQRQYYLGWEWKNNQYPSNTCEFKMKDKDTIQIIRFERVGLSKISYIKGLS
jgi:hypothetical protein